MNQYIGEIKIFPKNNIPKGFLPCNGQEVYINEYPRLYMVLGCRCDGEDNMKFKIPNITEGINEMMVYCIATEGEMPK